MAADFEFSYGLSGNKEEILSRILPTIRKVSQEIQKELGHSITNKIFDKIAKAVADAKTAIAAQKFVGDKRKRDDITRPDVFKKSAEKLERLGKTVYKKEVTSITGLPEKPSEKFSSLKEEIAQKKLLTRHNASIKEKIAIAEKNVSVGKENTNLLARYKTDVIELIEQSKKLVEFRKTTFRAQGKEITSLEKLGKSGEIGARARKLLNQKTRELKLKLKNLIESAQTSDANLKDFGKGISQKSHVTKITRQLEEELKKLTSSTAKSFNATNEYSKELNKLNEQTKQVSGASLPELRKQLAQLRNIFIKQQKQVESSTFKYTALTQTTDALSQKLLQNKGSVDISLSSLKGYNFKISEAAKSYRKVEDRQLIMARGMANYVKRMKEAGGEFLGTKEQLKKMQTILIEASRKIKDSGEGKETRGALGVALKKVAEQIKLKELAEGAKNAARSSSVLSLAVQDVANKFGPLNALIAQTVVRFSAFKIGQLIISRITFTLRAAIRGFVQLEQAVADVVKITQSRGFLAPQVFSTIVKLADKSARSIQEVSSAFLEFSRQGRTAQETIQLTEAATLAANVGFGNMQDAVNVLTISMSLFGKAAEESTQLISAFSTVSDRNAASISEMTQAFIRFAPTAEAFGVSVESTIALVASTIEATRLSGQQVGTALRTIVPRLVQHESELIKVGIATRTVSGEQRKLLPLLSDINKRFQTLSNSERIALGIRIVGVRQSSKFFGALKGIEKALINERIATQATTEAFKKQEVQLNTINSIIERITTNSQALFQLFAEGPIGSIFKTVAKSLGDALGVLRKMSETGFGKGLLGAISTGVILGGITILIVKIKELFASIRLLVSALNQKLGISKSSEVQTKKEIGGFTKLSQAIKQQILHLKELRKQKLLLRGIVAGGAQAVGGVVSGVRGIGATNLIIAASALTAAVSGMTEAGSFLNDATSSLSSVLTVAFTAQILNLKDWGANLGIVAVAATAAWQAAKFLNKQLDFTGKKLRVIEKESMGLSTSIDTASSKLNIILAETTTQTTLNRQKAILDITKELDKQGVVGLNREKIISEISKVRDERSLESAKQRLDILKEEITLEKTRERIRALQDISRVGIRARNVGASVGTFAVGGAVAGGMIGGPIGAGVGAGVGAAAGVIKGLIDASSELKEKFNIAQQSFQSLTSSMIAQSTKVKGVIKKTTFLDESRYEIAREIYKLDILTEKQKNKILESTKNQLNIQKELAIQEAMELKVLEKLSGVIDTISRKLKDIDVEFNKEKLDRELTFVKNAIETVRKTGISDIGILPRDTLQIEIEKLRAQSKTITSDLEKFSQESIFGIESVKEAIGGRIKDIGGGAEDISKKMVEGLFPDLDKAVLDNIFKQAKKINLSDIKKILLERMKDFEDVGKSKNLIEGIKKAEKLIDVLNTVSEWDKRIVFKGKGHEGFLKEAMGAILRASNQNIDFIAQELKKQVEAGFDEKGLIEFLGNKRGGALSERKDIMEEAIRNGKLTRENEGKLVELGENKNLVEKFRNTIDKEGLTIRKLNFKISQQTLNFELEHNKRLSALERERFNNLNQMLTKTGGIISNNTAEFKRFQASVKLLEIEMGIKFDIDALKRTKKAIEKTIEGLKIIEESEGPSTATERNLKNEKLSLKLIEEQISGKNKLVESAKLDAKITNISINLNEKKKGIEEKFANKIRAISISELQIMTQKNSLLAQYIENKKIEYEWEKKIGLAKIDVDAARKSLSLDEENFVNAIISGESKLIKIAGKKLHAGEDALVEARQRLTITEKNAEQDKIILDNKLKQNDVMQKLNNEQKIQNAFLDLFLKKQTAIKTARAPILDFGFTGRVSAAKGGTLQAFKQKAEMDSEINNRRKLLTINQNIKKNKEEQAIIEKRLEDDKNKGIDIKIIEQSQDAIKLKHLKEMSVYYKEQVKLFNALTNIEGLKEFNRVNIKGIEDANNKIRSLGEKRFFQTGVERLKEAINIKILKSFAREYLTGPKGTEQATRIRDFLSSLSPSERRRFQEAVSTGRGFEGAGFELAPGIKVKSVIEAISGTLGFGTTAKVVEKQIDSQGRLTVAIDKNVEVSRGMIQNIEALNVSLKQLEKLNGEELGKKLKEQLESANVTINVKGDSKIAFEVGLTQQFIQFIRNTKVADKAVLKEIAKHFVNSLIMDTDVKGPEKSNIIEKLKKIIDQEIDKKNGGE